MEYDETVSEEPFSKIEFSVCNIYGKSKMKSVNETRSDIKKDIRQIK